jgi:hypothetical protein
VGGLGRWVGGFEVWWEGGREIEGEGVGGREREREGGRGRIIIIVLAIMHFAIEC